MIKKSLFYGLGVFSVYIILTYVLRKGFDRIPIDAKYFGIYTDNDILIGIIVAIALTFSHIQKSKNNDKEN